MASTKLASTLALCDPQDYQWVCKRSFTEECVRQHGVEPCRQQLLARMLAEGEGFNKFEDLQNTIITAAAVLTGKQGLV